MDRAELIEVALGKTPPDLVIRGGNLVNVHTAEIYPADIAVKGDRIAAVGEVRGDFGSGALIVDARGKYITPGLIDPHIHAGETFLNMPEFARVVMPRGTTGVVTDFCEAHIVAGPRAVRHALAEAKKTPLKVYFVIMQQAVGLEKVGTYPRDMETIVKEMEEMLMWPETIGVNEPPLTPVLKRDPKAMRLIQKARKMSKVIIGHYPYAMEQLNAYLTIGAYSDHESKQPDEALAKARLGMRVWMREGSPSPDLLNVVKAIAERRLDTRHFALCSDDMDLVDLIQTGHMDDKIRKTIGSGVDPATAVQMATINVADYFHQSDEVGSIAPGKLADMVLVDDLPTFNVSTVIANGRIVARDGKYKYPKLKATPPPFMRNIVKLKRLLTSQDFRIPAKTPHGKVKCNVIAVDGASLITKLRKETMRVDRGMVGADPQRDILKVAIVECHRGTGQTGLGFISGFGLKGGAIASTHNHLYYNLAVVGASDGDMATAVNELARLGGGFIAVKNNRPTACLPLPHGGVMSEKPFEQVYALMEKLKVTVASLGCTLRSPFLTMSFITLPAIPEVAITDRGIVDVSSQKLVNLIEE